MKTCPSCGEDDPALCSNHPVEHLRCQCYNEDPRTYWSCIIQCSAGGLSRGAFKTKAAAREWAAATVPDTAYTLKEYPNAAFIAPAFNAEALKAAVSKRSPRGCMTIILSGLLSSTWIWSNGSSSPTTEQNPNEQARALRRQSGGTDCGQG